MRRTVLHGEPQRQSPREGHTVDRAERLRPELSASVAVAEAEGQGQPLGTRGLDPIQMPRRGARETVLWRRRRMPVRTEPREDDRDAAADRLARHEYGVGAGEQHGSLAWQPPGGHLRSLQVQLAHNAAQRDRCLDQPVLRLDEIEDAGMLNSAVSSLARIEAPPVETIIADRDASTNAAREHWSLRLTADAIQIEIG